MFMATVNERDKQTDGRLTVAIPHFAPSTLCSEKTPTYVFFYIFVKND